MRRHSTEEISSKVKQAEELMARGQSQAQACKVLGVSVMTFHRWRKQEAARGHQANGTVTEFAARTDDRDGIPLSITVLMNYGWKMNGCAGS
ncbi:helix-turn-helix domain-containing protein [Bradyrhizobium elkanii]|uniref:helix-turn-helix domain-containing protein n=2 Tax=Bradyrhizobium elkanii TaxID=29448 RepID=UPI002714BD89|nr:helix-turn-helix domain-containing protein [Bradyrhizobium elkanii]WLB75152.1 helix-turn-helix domain-containing protein [Bradyrhizobium elkanii]